MPVEKIVRVVRRLFSLKPHPEEARKILGHAYSSLERYGIEPAHKSIDEALQDEEIRNLAHEAARNRLRIDQSAVLGASVTGAAGIATVLTGAAATMPDPTLAAITLGPGILGLVGAHAFGEKFRRAFRNLKDRLSKRETVPADEKEEWIRYAHKSLERSGHTVKSLEEIRTDKEIIKTAEEVVKWHKRGNVLTAGGLGLILASGAAAFAAPAALAPLIILGGGLPGFVLPFAALMFRNGKYNKLKKLILDKSRAKK